MNQKYSTTDSSFHASISSINKQNSLSLSKRMQEKSNHASSLSKSLPSLKVSKSHASSSDYFGHLLSPPKKLPPPDQIANRLSGLGDPVNTSSLFSDIALPVRPVTLCLRCGNHASLCMPCAEQDCENALTFYRKTRAAGAATLFQKAFIEAGFTKLIKFVVFRLMKNSIEAKKRLRMKKKTAVEKLFGTNVVCMPFAAWKRYTKENVLNRKNKEIETLSERVKFLEAQVHKMSTQLQENHFQMDFYRSEIAKRDRCIVEQVDQIKTLKEDVKAHQLRVKSLVQLLIPLETCTKSIEHITQSKISETNRFIHQAATQASSYNYSYFLSPDVLDPLVGKNPLDNKKTRVTGATVTNVNLNPAMSFTSVTKLTTKLPSKTMAVATLISLSWLLMVAKNADDQIEPTTGKSMSYFLPKFQEAETLFDLRSGRNICRAIISIINERQTMFRHHDMTATINPCTERYIKIWPNNALELEDLEHIKTLEGKTTDLINFSLTLATNILEIPSFSAMDIFSGKTEVIYQLVISLMNAAMPRVNVEERNVIEQKITEYYQITNDLHEMKQNKPDLSKFDSILHFLDKELRVKKKLVEVVINPETLEYEKAPSMDGEEAKDRAEDIETAVEADENKEVAPSASIEETKAVDEQDNDTNTSTVKAIEVEEELGERIPVMAMTDAQYEMLCKLLDQAIDVDDYKKVNDTALRAIELNRQLLDLQSSITAGRDARELNVRFTTEIRQFLLAHCFNTSYTMTSALQKECQRLEGVVNDNTLKLHDVEKELLALHRSKKKEHEEEDEEDEDEDGPEKHHSNKKRNHRKGEHKGGHHNNKHH